MNIILLGPPGAGKDTQGKLLAKKFHLSRLSAGARLRQALHEKRPEGVEAGNYMEQGLNVPAKLLFKVLQPWFNKHRQGFIIDNLPRSREQLEAFKDFISTNKIKIDKVFHLRVSEKEAIKRLLSRAKERKERGNSRIDENEEVIRQRYQTGYIKDIEPILSFFHQNGVLEEIDGEKPITKIHQKILKKLSKSAKKF